jgi:hypothetical protein
MPVLSQAACGSYMGANRPPSEGVEYRLGSSIIKTASPKKCGSYSLAGSDSERGNMNLHLVGRLGVHGLLRRTGISSFGKSRGLRRCQLESQARGSTLAGCCLCCHSVCCCVCCVLYTLSFQVTDGLESRKSSCSDSQMD